MTDNADAACSARVGNVKEEPTSVVSQEFLEMRSQVGSFDTVDDECLKHCQAHWAFADDDVSLTDSTRLRIAAKRLVCDGPLNQQEAREQDLLENPGDVVFVSHHP